MLVAVARRSRRSCGSATSPTRGTWDADQGHDMLVLRALVRDGSVPLLGPPTSIGDFHHGALYYFLLAPAALLTGGDPVAVTALDRARPGSPRSPSPGGSRARSAGPVAGARRGAADGGLGERGRRIDLHLEPEPDRPVERDRAGRGAWRAWRRGRAALVARWRASAAVVTMQCHVLGVLLPPVIAGLLVADVRVGAGRRGAGRRRCGRRARRGSRSSRSSYVPLAIHELDDRLLGAAGGARLPRGRRRRGRDRRCRSRLPIVGAARPRRGP